MCKIKIVDAICGSGKTSAAIEYMKNETEANFVYVTPILTEVERIKESCKSRNFYEPKGWGSKMRSFHELVKKGSNVATTHSLFKDISQATKDILKLQNYVLILDEVMSVVEPYPITKSDLDIIIEHKLAHVDEDFYLVWDDSKYKGKYEDVKILAENRSLVVLKDIALLWNFPVDIFSCFQEVWILTYIFDGQIQKTYFDYHGAEYEYYGVSDDMKSFTEGFHESKIKYGNLINVYDGKYNTIGKAPYSLSKTWYDKATEDSFEILRNNLTNYFRFHLKSKTSDNMWTTFRRNESKVKGKGYTRGFMSCNARATNEFKHKKNLAYCINRYNNPVINNFFTQKKLSFDQDKYALSELIQWIFRSQLREKQPINIYIPSERMRKLLLEWMKDN